MRRLTLLGGTQFIGRALVEAAPLDGGHTSGIFNRGETKPTGKD
jgi:hypothetical protein